MNLVLINVFAVFAFNLTSDPKSCYVVTTEDDPRLEHDIAVTYGAADSFSYESRSIGSDYNLYGDYQTPEDAKNEARLFKEWFLAGIFLGVINIFILIGDAVMKS